MTPHHDLIARLEALVFAVDRWASPPQAATLREAIAALTEAELGRADEPDEVDL